MHTQKAPVIDCLQYTFLLFACSKIWAVLLIDSLPESNNMVAKSQYPASSTAESTSTLKGSVPSTPNTDSLLKQINIQAQEKAEVLTLTS